METIVVYPHRGIGKILFGMTRKEAEEILMSTSYTEKNDGDGISVRYDDYDITYKDNTVFEIIITNYDKYTVMFNDIDLFCTKSEDIFDYLKKLSNYECDCEDEYLSRTYYFKDLGLSLWRESVFHPKPMQEDWLKELIAVQEELKSIALKYGL